MTRAGIGLILCCLVAGAGAQTIGDAQAIDLLAANCGKDIATFSTQENLDGGRVQRCLLHNQATVSGLCKAATAAIVDSLQGLEEVPPGFSVALLRKQARDGPADPLRANPDNRVLQPLSLEASVGVNLALGVAGLRLQ